ncbi:MAG TPA: PRC-barrel domain-containing protein [Acidisphaera sp.]|nr:PRC-barrel domain-containing protein [Acidisphaera sp.]
MTRRLILAAFAFSALACPAFAQGHAEAAGSGESSPKPPETRLLPRTEAMPILGQDVASGGTVVGRLIDLLVGEDGQPRAAVLDVGGFMGMGARDVTVDWSTLHFAPTEKQHPITTTLSPDQIRSAPEYKNPDQPAAVVVQPKTPDQPPAVVAPPSAPSQPAAPVAPPNAANQPAAPAVPPNAANQPAATVAPPNAANQPAAAVVPPKP